MRPEAPWIRFEQTGLHVVPSIHHRLAFAHSVYRSCYEKRFDVIAVELPRSLRDVGLVESVRRRAPVPVLLIQPSGILDSVELPARDRPGGREPQNRRVERGFVLPITSSDSMVMALRCPALLQERWPGWDPEIHFVDAEHEPEPVRRALASPSGLDDYEVQVRGPRAFWRIWEARRGASPRAELDEQRDRVMAARLRPLIDSGASVLFVCGAAHWPGIERHLRSPGALPPAEEQKPDRRDHLIVPVDPFAAWLWGWLDDLPRLVWEFEEACRRGPDGGRRFDKRRALDVIWEGSIGEARRQGLGVSVRALGKMARYLERLVAASGRWIPELDSHLIHAVETCVGEAFADVVEAQALHFPARAGRKQEATIHGLRQGAYLIEFAGRTFLLTFPKGGRKLVLRTRVRPPESEAREDSGRWMRDWPEEVELRRSMEARAQRLALRRIRPPRSRRFAGTLAEGPDWRRTVRSFASGQRQLYVREAGPARGAGWHPDPFVWIFDSRCRIVERDCVNWERAPSPCIATLLYIASSRFLARGRIRADRLAAFTDFNLVPPPGDLCLEGPASRARALRSVRKLPHARICRVVPWKDPEFASFAGTHQAIAAAIRYASRRVIVVAPSTAAPDADVMAYAKRRGIELCRLALEEFPVSLVQRFRDHHFAPSPIDSYHAPYAWCRKYVPPIYG